MEKGEDHMEDKTEMFDPSTGKKCIPFAKATKVTSDVNLMYSLMVFTTTRFNKGGTVCLFHQRDCAEIVSKPLK